MPGTKPGSATAIHRIVLGVVARPARVAQGGRGVVLEELTFLSSNALKQHR
jgi:hypothetical protein